MLSSGFSSSRIVASTRSIESAEKVKELGVKATTDNEYVVKNSDIVILSVKPSVVLKVARELRHLLRDRIVVSVAALVPRKALVEAIDSDEVYRAMPNIAVEVNRSFTALAPIEKSRGNGGSLVNDLFRLLGEVVWVDESVLDYLTLISASLPAIVAELADTMVLAALYIGIPHDIALKAIGVVLEGVGKMMITKPISDIRNMVVTPKGITIRMIRKFYGLDVKSRFLEALMQSGDEYMNLLESYRAKFVHQ